MTARGVTVVVAAVAGLTLSLNTTVAAASAPRGGEPAPKGLPDFYSVPAKYPRKPGSLIKSQKLDLPDIKGSLHRVMYVSEGEQGEPTVVTGTVAVPEGKAPKGGFPVIASAHGTTGMADQCAPSLDPAENAPVVNAILDKGWAVAATDYQGLGTPGLHPYIAGQNAARNTIDNVRAARQLDGVKLSDDYVAWGHSQGGHTAMHVDQLGPEYAPELNLKGVVAGAPPSQFNLIYDFLLTSDFRHYLLMAAGGLNQAYGDKAAPLDAVLTTEGTELLLELEKACSGDLQEHFADVDFETVIKADPFTVPAWRDILTAEDPQSFSTPSEVPLLIIHGGEDEQIPTVSSQLLADHLCRVGQSLVRWVYPGTSHAGVIEPSLDDMLTWIENRFADGPNPDPYTPAGRPDVEVTRC